MTDLNSVVIVGRLTQDCQFNYLQSGVALCRFSVAVNRSKKNQNGEWQDEASFFNVTIFGKLAENVNKRLKKGVQVAVAGFLKQDRWQKDGQNFSSVGIIADSIQIFAPKQNQEQNYQGFVAEDIRNHNYSQNVQLQNNQQNYQQNQMQQPSFQQVQQVNNQNIGDEYIGFVEDIPF